MKKLLVSILLFLPLSSFASTIPAFPMSFYGSVTVNGTPAPVGTIVRAYYGDTLAGMVTVTEPGIYGYDDPTKKQLLVGSGTGTITFSFQSASLNGGVETKGTAVQSEPMFTEGKSAQKNLAFTFTVPTPPPPPPPAPVSSGGGGGGSSSPAVYYGCMDKKATNYSAIANRDNGACVYPKTVATSTLARTASSTTVIASTTAPALPQVLGASTYRFLKYLTLGSTGPDVVELQKILIAKKYFTGPATGFFGPMTFAAVKKFQIANGLEPVGSVGPKTRAALNQSSQGAVLGISTETRTTELTPEAKAALIQVLITQIAELTKQVAALKAAKGL